MALREKYPELSCWPLSCYRPIDGQCIDSISIYGIHSTFVMYIFLLNVKQIHGFGYTMAGNEGIRAFTHGIKHSHQVKTFPLKC